jgi:hypothetical protein
VDTNASYVLVNRGSGKALDVSGASTADGAAVHQRARHDGANQRFQFVDSGGGYYRLKARHSGKVLDVSNCSTADHADVVQWSDAPPRSSRSPCRPVHHGHGSGGILLAGRLHAPCLRPDSRDRQGWLPVAVSSLDRPLLHGAPTGAFGGVPATGTGWPR